MRLAGYLLGALLLMANSAAKPQEPLCNPCVDGPVTLPRAATIRPNDEPPSARALASRTQELGGELRDIAHDCGAASTKRLGQIDFSATACSWGGRYPALLFESVDTDDAGPLVLLASNGSTLEVLFAEAPPASFVAIFSGLLKSDFDELFREIRGQSEG